MRSALVYEEAGLRDRALAAARSVLEAGYSRQEIDKAPPLERLRKTRAPGRWSSESPGARTRSEEDPDMPMPPIPRKIQIVVNSTYEDFSINPARCSVFPLNDVEWDVKVDGQVAEEFLLIFDSGQAFGRSVLWHSPSAPLGPQQPSGPRGSEYHYKIVVKQQGKVYVDAYCPSIIIR